MTVLKVPGFVRKYNLFSFRLKVSLLVVLLCSLVGCGGLFFFPDKTGYSLPSDFNLPYKDLFFESSSGHRLHSWYLPATTTEKGTVFFLHGNGENISTHIASVQWLPAEGFNVLLFEYRGYGLSTGKPTVSNVIEDIEMVYLWGLNNEWLTQPIFLFGQSLGGSIAAYAAATSDVIKTNTNALVIEGAFAEYRTILREVLSASWLTTVFKYPLSILAPACYDPVDVISEISPMPVLIIHSTEDEVIPYHHGLELYQASEYPKRFISTNGSHVGAFNIAENRQALLQYFDEVIEQTCCKAPYVLEIKSTDSE